MRYMLLAVSLCYAGSLMAAVQPLGEVSDSSSPAPAKVDVPQKPQAPFEMKPFVTDKGQRAELVTPEVGEQYAIIPIPEEHPDPLDDSSERNTDSEWQLLTW